jgi:tetratricopeptide (TPR) repeat protein
MPEFRAFITYTTRSPQTDKLISRIQQGTPAERESAFEQLFALARQDNNLDTWNTVGVGLHFAGRNDEATQLFDRLVRAAPSNDAYRLNLATSYSQNEQIALCREQLLYVAEHGSTEENRKLAREQLQGYDSFLGNTEQDHKLADLQMRSLRQRIAQSSKTAEDFNNLGRLLVKRGRLDPTGDGLEQAVTVLEAGTAAFPKDVELLELLISCYLRHDPNQHLDLALKRLERMAPDSRVLSVLANQDEEEGRQFVKNNQARADDLLQQVIQGDQTRRTAALHDLAGLVNMYRDNPFYRGNYAFALMVSGQTAAALQQAEILEKNPAETHSFHFNLGQVYWLCGDARNGRQHLQLAYNYAANDQERQDVKDRISDLERGPR